MTSDPTKPLCGNPPPLNVRLKGDKDKGRFCTHGVELIKWCKICDGVAPVSPEPPEMETLATITFNPKTGEMTHENHIPNPPAPDSERALRYRERLKLIRSCYRDLFDAEFRDAGTVGATPEPESKADQQWLHLVAKLNTIHAQLQHKPSHLKCGHRQEIGSILNAYREGDLSFDEAKLAAQSLPSPAPQDATKWIQRTVEMSGWDVGRALQKIESVLEVDELAKVLIAYAASSPAQPAGSADPRQGAD